MVAEAGDQLAVVEPPLGPERAAVEQLVVLLLLQHDVQQEAQRVHVREDDLPLVELAAVEAQRASGAVQGQTSLPSPSTFIVRK